MYLYSDELAVLLVTMILECKSCQKKFIVPDNAITSAGRLVQCSSCGNKWTQFPIKNQFVSKSKKVQTQTKKEIKSFVQIEKKKKKIKKKTGPSIYSKEYLEKKHGIKIDEKSLRDKKVKIDKSASKSYFGFYSFLTIFIITILFLIGILNLTKEIIIFNFPFTEIYIEYLFENLNYFRILFRDALNLN